MKKRINLKSHNSRRKKRLNFLLWLCVGISILFVIIFLYTLFDESSRFWWEVVPYIALAILFLGIAHLFSRALDAIYGDEYVQKGVSDSSEKKKSNQSSL